MAERRWQAVIWIRCFTRRRFSCSRKNSIAVDPADQRFRPDCRKWVRRFCISMRSSRAPTIPSSKSSAYRT
ncbi:hypothetical protein MKX01_001070 [Papaver californicum]|nr:hypothetical protein MKX01_039720 [Papaver californicum]KAI3983666.1 hypothetical protein MKX01_001070 [Papaver californicum]